MYLSAGIALRKINRQEKEGQAIVAVVHGEERRSMADWQIGRVQAIFPKLTVSPISLFEELGVRALAAPSNFQRLSSVNCPSLNASPRGGVNEGGESGVARVVLR